MSTIEQLSERLKTVTEELERISNAIAIAKNTPTPSTPIQELAIRIHEKTCYANHIDDCSWGYEVRKGVHDWDASTHKRYLKKANKLLEFCRHDIKKANHVLDALDIIKEYV